MSSRIEQRKMNRKWVKAQLFFNGATSQVIGRIRACGDPFRGELPASCLISIRPGKILNGIVCLFSRQSWLSGKPLFLPLLLFSPDMHPQNSCSPNHSYNEIFVLQSPSCLFNWFTLNQVSQIETQSEFSRLNFLSSRSASKASVQKWANGLFASVWNESAQCMACLYSHFRTNRISEWRLPSTIVAHSSLSLIRLS